MLRYYLRLSYLTQFAVTLDVAQVKLQRIDDKKNQP